MITFIGFIFFNRQQFVYLNGAKFTLVNIDCGVRQGRITGHIIFILHIKDMMRSSNLGKFTIYTDDSSLNYATIDVEETVPVLNIDLPKVDVWLSKNQYLLLFKNIPNEFSLPRAVLAPKFSLFFDRQKCITTRTRN